MIVDDDESLDDEEFPDDRDTDDIEGSDADVCPECGREVYDACEHCPSCGHWIPAERPAAPRRLNTIWRVAAVLVVASMLWWLAVFFRLFN